MTEAHPPRDSLSHPDVTDGLRPELGGYREYRPAAPLAAVAEAVWTHRAAAAEMPTGVGMHRVLPDPALNLAFRCRRLADGTVVEPRLVAIGPKTRPFLFGFHAGDEIAAVKVKLEWARYLLDLVPADHLDREDDLAGAVPALAATAHALDLVRRTTGRLRVEAVAGRMGISERQLRRAVRHEAAFSLKAYARITRLNHAMALADRAARPPWARIAAEAGFCDQSHLVRECRALAGPAPGRVHRERRAQADLSNRG